MVVGIIVYKKFDVDMVVKLCNLVYEISSSEYMILFSVLSVFFFKIYYSNDFILGIVVSGWVDVVIENMLGMFINILFVCVNIKLNLIVFEYLVMMKKMLLVLLVY